MMKRIALLLLCATATSHAQGSLAPPSGTPAPTMKSLDQIEARTPVPASPAIPVAGPHFTITAPGSYYLTGNVTVASGTGIVIDSSDVTLDLNGFTISSTQAGITPASAAVLVEGSPRSNIAVRNGFVRSGAIFVAGDVQGNGFESGINLNSAVDPAVVSDIHVSGVSEVGIFINGGMVSNSSVRASDRGIAAATVSGCRVELIRNRGIEGEIVTDSYARSLNTEAIYSGGNVTNCYASSNIGASAINCEGTVSHSRARRDGGVAITAGIAVACTVDGTGTISSAQKHLGTP